MPAAGRLLACLMISMLLLTGCKPTTPTAPVSDKLPPASQSQPVSPNSPNPSAAKADPAALVKEADTLLLKGDTGEAAEKLLQVVGKFPDHAPAWDLLSLAYRRLDQYAAAEAFGDRAVSLSPNSATARFNAAMAYSSLNFAKAIAHMEMAAKLNPTDSQVAYALGALYEATDLPKAKAFYQQSLTRWPNDPDLKRANAAMVGDLNMDGVTEKIQVMGITVLVQDGVTNKELLRWEDTSRVPGTTIVQAIDIGGSQPVLMIIPPARASVILYIWRAGQLTSLETLNGSGSYGPVQRRLGINILDKSLGLARNVYWSMRDGKLTQVGIQEEPFKDTQLPAPKTLVDLVADVASLRSNSKAFADYQLIQEIKTRIKGSPSQTNGVLLLPEPGGSYRLEVELDGQVTATAKATVSTSTGYQITKLVWQ